MYECLVSETYFPSFSVSATLSVLSQWDPKVCHENAADVLLSRKLSDSAPVSKQHFVTGETNLL